VNAVTNLRVPQNAGNFLTLWEPVSFTRMTLLHGVLLLLLLLLFIYHNVKKVKQSLYKSGGAQRVPGS